MPDKTDLIREIHEYVTTHGGENTATHLLVQAASAIQTQAAELEAVGAGGVQALSAAPAIGDELRDTLVAVSAAIADQDDLAAQAMLREILKAPQPSHTPQADSQSAPQGETNAQLDTDSNNSTPGQQRDVAGTVALGQPVGNGEDQAASHLGTQGDKLLIVAERNIRSFLRSAVFKSESDREAALNCVDVLWEAARAPADSQPAVQQVDATRAAARALSDRFAEMCNVDKEDHWQDHSDDVLSDAELVVSTYLAARAPADSVTAPAGGANWQDISTAPKDGTRFVAVGNNYGRYSETQHTCIAQWFRGCWMEVSDWNEASELKYLTHWMPLPSPPDDVAAPAEQQAEESCVKLLAECRDAFPIPEPSSPLEVQWSAAMARPEEVPEYVRLCVAAMQAAPKAAPVKACVCGEPQAPGTVHRVDGPCYVAAPQQEAQRPWGYAWRQSPFGWGFCSKQAYEQAAGRGEEVAKLYTEPQPAPAPLSDDAKDAARLDWLALAGPTSICVVIDRPHDSEVEVATDDVTGYGKTLREALDAAIAAQGDTP